MPPLAVDVLAAMSVHGVIARHADGTVGHQLLHHPGDQLPSQTHARPAALGEDPAIARRIAGHQRAERPQQIEDGVVADGQQGGAEEEREAEGGRSCEGLEQPIEEALGGPGQLVVQGAQTSANHAGLAGLPLPALLALGFGQAVPSGLAYTGHRGLLAGRTGWVTSP